MLFFALPLSNGKPDMETLIERYSASLTRLCFLYLKDYHLAQEAVQEALFRAYRKYDGFGFRSSEKTWVTSIAVNVCKDMMKSPSYREKPLEPELEQQLKTSDFSHSSDWAVTLVTEVSRLPVLYREVVLMRYYRQMSVGEIGKALHVKPNTVSVRLRRAQEMLKERLEDAI